MDVVESLAHTRWDCKFHIVFIPKYRKKSLFNELRKHLERRMACFCKYINSL
jgi:putative transposase